MSTIRNELRAFIEHNFYAAQRLGDTDSLVESGTIDSTGMLELIDHIEYEYGLEVSENEMVAGNFDSIERLAVFVEHRLAQAKLKKLDLNLDLDADGEIEPETARAS